MPEAFQPVDHLLVSRAESSAKESLKTFRQLPGMPDGPAEAGAPVVLGAVGAGVDVLVGGAAGVVGAVVGAEVGPEVGAEVGAEVDTTLGGAEGATRWWSPSRAKAMSLYKKGGSTAVVGVPG